MTPDFVGALALGWLLGMATAYAIGAAQRRRHPVAMPRVSVTARLLYEWDAAARGGRPYGIGPEMGRGRAAHRGAGAAGGRVRGG